MVRTESVSETNKRDLPCGIAPASTHLEVTMCAQALLDVTRPSTFRSQLNGFEVLNIRLVEEHVSDRSSLLVNLERMTSQDNAFGRDSSRV